MKIMSNAKRFGKDNVNVKTSVPEITKFNAQFCQLCCKNISLSRAISKEKTSQDGEELIV